jgi:hypothetical protein
LEREDAWGDDVIVDPDVDPAVDPDAPDDLILSHLVADVNELRRVVNANADVAEQKDKYAWDGIRAVEGMADNLWDRASGLERRIEALEQAAAPVEDTQDGPPDRYAIGESGKPGYRTMVTDGGHPIAVCQKRADAERIAAALNAEPSAEVQAVVEAAKAHHAKLRRIGGALAAGETTQRLLAAVDALNAKEATT